MQPLPPGGPQYNPYGYYPGAEETAFTSGITTTVPVGSVSSVKNIYKTPKDKDGQTNWTDKYPVDAEEPAENDETETFAVLVRNRKSEDSRKKLEAESILIQSPLLKEALGEFVLKDYRGVSCELDRLNFNAPFEPFVHRWAEFVALCRREDLEPTLREHVDLLYGVLKYEIGHDIKVWEDYVANGVITFEHLWMIFQPGSVVVSEHKGPLSAFELVESRYAETDDGKVLSLWAECVDFGLDGKYFGRSRVLLCLNEFKGTRKIDSLSAFPLSFHKRQAEVCEKLIKRGEVFEKLAGHHYKAYEGAAVTWNRERQEVLIQVSGRIVIDIESFNRFAQSGPLVQVQEFTIRDRERIKEAQKAREETGVEETHNDWSTDVVSGAESSNDSVGAEGVPGWASASDDEPLQKLIPYHRMLARSRTRGYSLKLKKWLDFFVDQVQDIVWDDGAFEQLVIPDDQKDLILAFSEAQIKHGQSSNGLSSGGKRKYRGVSEDDEGFDDVISGKGRGVVCLLSGPPGVGKTLTAEAVAENLRVPLHTLSSGDLGSDAFEVEAELARILDLVSRWGAILLLDECDVFLEARSSAGTDMERNKIVSIFLRTLEYYEGIMFMTTNRLGNIDPAFASRIHVAMQYGNLSAASRKRVWRNFLLGAGAGGGQDKAKRLRAKISEKDLDELAQLELNGRQIKNAVKMAQLLSLRKRSALERGHIDTILAIEKRRPALD